MKNVTAGKATKIIITKPGKKQAWFSLRIIIFDPKKRFIGSDEAKEVWRKAEHIAIKKMKEEFQGVYAAATVVGRGKNKHIEFNKTTKNAANVIFVIPNKYRKEACKEIQNLEIMYTKDLARFI